VRCAADGSWWLGRPRFCSQSMASHQRRQVRPTARGSSVGRVIRLEALTLAMIVAGCGGPGATTTPPPLSPSPSAVGLCHDGLPGPRVRYGSLDLSPTVHVIQPGATASPLLQPRSSPSPAHFQLDVPAINIGDAFEICVTTSPAAANTHLGVFVTGKLEDPVGSQYWQDLFSTTFLAPLQNQVTDANGVLEMIVPAQTLLGTMNTNPPPPGYSSGRMLISITPGLGASQYWMDLTVQGPP
jgi:hypothetical protein